MAQCYGQTPHTRRFHIEIAMIWSAKITKIVIFREMNFCCRTPLIIKFKAYGGVFIYAMIHTSSKRHFWLVVRVNYREVGKLVRIIPARSTDIYSLRIPLICHV